MPLGFLYFLHKLIVNFIVKFRKAGVFIFPNPIIVATLGLGILYLLTMHTRVLCYLHKSTHNFRVPVSIPGDFLFSRSPDCRSSRAKNFLLFNHALRSTSLSSWTLNFLI
jgi:hypothetical protein